MTGDLIPGIETQSQDPFDDFILWTRQNFSPFNHHDDTARKFLEKNANGLNLVQVAIASQWLKISLFPAAVYGFASFADYMRIGSGLEDGIKPISIFHPVRAFDVAQYLWHIIGEMEQFRATYLANVTIPYIERSRVKRGFLVPRGGIINYPLSDVAASDFRLDRAERNLAMHLPEAYQELRSTYATVDHRLFANYQENRSEILAEMFKIAELFLGDKSEKLIEICDVLDGVN